MSWYFFKPYVSVAKRRENALKELKKLEKNGRTVSPVTIDGKKIASTFWGKAWCDHLESYSDYESRLPRGRSYLRNGMVVDLQIEPGRVTAMVSGSELYKVSVKIKPLAAPCWDCIKRDCGGAIGSVIELLQGRLSTEVMERVTRRDGGLFPQPAEITKDCSCPDWADMCKHVAAVLYGIGARLDRQPELLFVLRKVDHLELIERAADVDKLVRTGAAAGQKTIGDDQLADVFGIDLAPDAGAPVAPVAPAAPTAAPARPSPRKRAASSRPAPPPVGQKARPEKPGAAPPGKARKSKRAAAAGAEARKRPKARGRKP
jgi:uncharacterized Zn finger protein